MARQVDNDDLNTGARGQYDLRQTPEREVFLKEHNLFADKSPSVPPLPSGYDTDKYRGISVSEVTALNDSVFDDRINTTYPSRVNAATTISEFIHGNYQNSSLSIYSNSFHSSDRFSNSHTAVPLSLAISNHNPPFEVHPLYPDVKKNLTNLTDEVLSGKILLFNLNMCHHGIGGQFTKKRNS